MNTQHQKWKKPLVIFLDVSFVLLSVFSGKISSMMIDDLEGCRIFENLGIKCLTCGGTRCVNALAGGRIKEAFFYNSFVPVALTAVFIILMLMSASWIFNVRKAEVVLQKLCRVRTAVVISVFVFFYLVLRNLYPILLFLLRT